MDDGKHVRDLPEAIRRAIFTPRKRLEPPIVENAALTLEQQHIQRSMLRRGIAVDFRPGFSTRNRADVSDVKPDEDD